jgi:hypothetical protein
MKNKILLSALLLAASSTSAIAAEQYNASILSMEGNVLVNQGESYQTATPGMNLKEGDRVMIMEGAKLSMKYPDDCTFSFKDGQIIEVGGISACAMGATGFVSATSAQYVQAAPGASDEEDDKVGGIAATSAGVTGAAFWSAAAAATALYVISLKSNDSTFVPPIIITPPPPISR